MKNILTVKHIAYFVLFGVFLLLSSPSFAVKVINSCNAPQVQCCPGGVKSCCDPRTDGLDYDLSCFMEDLPITIKPGILPDDPVVPTSCTEGKEKYTADALCGYKTETCCSGKWCDKTCKSCTDTSKSVNCSGNIDHAISGTLTYTRTVKSNCGSCTYNSWTSSGGSCNCANGYEWKNGQCQSTATPTTGTWICSLGTLVHIQGITIPQCTVSTSNPPWPKGRSCNPNTQEYCEGKYFQEGGNIVEGGTNDYTSFYCWCSAN